MGDAPMAIMVPMETPVSLRAVKKANWKPINPVTPMSRATGLTLRKKPNPRFFHPHHARRIIPERTIRMAPTVSGGAPAGASA